MSRHAEQIILIDERLFEADVVAARRWLRGGMASLSGRYALLSPLALYGVWLAVGAYNGIFGLPSGGGEVATDPTPLLGLAVYCTLAIACVLGMFLLPRWEMPHAAGGASRHFVHTRMAAFASAILMVPWINPGLPLAVVLVPLVAASACRQCEIETGGISPSALLARLALQGTWAFVSMVWLVLWSDIWLHVAIFWLPEATSGATLLVMLAIVSAGCIVQSAMRLADRRWPISGLACVAAALCLANPGIPGLVGGALYVMKAGGGRFDIEASVAGRPVCDMGALGRHYYVPAGREGCTLERATRMVGMLRDMPDGRRATFLLTHRVKADGADR
jgi:hypothetical protein